MHRSRNRVLPALAIAAVAVVSIGPLTLTVRDAYSQQSTLPVQPSIIEVGLEQGERTRTWQYLVDYTRLSRGPIHIDPDVPPDRGHIGFQLVVSNADPMVEVGISLEGPKCPFQALRVEERITGRAPRETIDWGAYRRLYVAEDDEIWFSVDGYATPDELYFTDEGRDARAYECVLTIALSRVYDRCSLYATVSGDVNGSFFGDVAYFNTYDEAVPVPLDPGTMGLLEDLLGMAAPPPDPDNPGPVQQPSFADALAAWAAEDTEPSPMSGRFNLSASNVLFGDGDFGGTGMFSFSAVGPGVVDVGEAIAVPLTYVAALPGALDANFGGAKFLWSEGQPGSATLYLMGATENMLVGMFEADLFTEREYSPPGRRLQIKLEARFLAQRGALACQ